MSTSSRGSARERQVRKRLEAEGWAVTRGAGSHGCADLWAATEIAFTETGTWGQRMDIDLKRPVTALRLIQVKTDKAGPYAHFLPADRKELAALAARTGGDAELWWWPANKPMKLIPQSDWPV